MPVKLRSEDEHSKIEGASAKALRLGRGVFEGQKGGQCRRSKEKRWEVMMG